MFGYKKETMLDKIRKTILENDSIKFYYSELKEKMNFQEMKQYMGKVIPEILAKNKNYHMNIHYITFTDGTKKIDTSLHSFSLIPTELNDCLFTNIDKNWSEKIHNCKNLTDLFMPIFYLSSNDLDMEILKSIDYKNLPILNNHIWDLVYKEFKYIYKECEGGYYEDLSCGVGKTYSIYICNKNIPIENLKMICRILQAYYTEALKNGKLLNKILNNFYINPLELFPELKSKDSFINLIAYGNKVLVREIITFDKYSWKEIIIEAIHKNPECYTKINERYQKDKDICMEVIKMDISYISWVLEYGTIPKEKLQKVILELIKE